MHRSADKRGHQMSSIAVSAEGIALPSWSRRCKISAKKVLREISEDSHEISIVFCNNHFIENLNKDYRGKDEPTDVLSFAQYDGDSINGHGLAGDIVISLDAAAENAREFHVDEEEEIKRLIVHGIMHLLGWDHSDNSPEQEMLKLQEKILADLKGERLL